MLTACSYTLPHPTGYLRAVRAAPATTPRTVPSPLSHTPQPDEFGNYIGPDLDSDDSDDSAADGEAAPADDEMEQDPNPNALAMTSQIQADADEGAASNAIVLHEDKK